MRSSIAALAALSLVVALAGGSARGTETLASADFEGDEAGAVAKPAVSPAVEVSEDIWDHSSGPGGSACVVSVGSGKRFRIDDLNAPNRQRGIRAPLSSVVSSGVLTVQATLLAEQTDGSALCCVSDPDEEEWYGLIGFGADGKFVVHGSSTDTSYSADTSYRVTITVTFGSNRHVDYLVTDASGENTVLQSTGNTLAEGATAGNVTFDTGMTTEGAFTLDDLLATR